MLLTYLPENGHLKNSRGRATAPSHLHPAASYAYAGSCPTAHPDQPSHRGYSISLDIHGLLYYITVYDVYEYN